MVPLNEGTLSLGWWSVVYAGGPKMMVGLSFSPGWPAVASCCAMLWWSSCSSCARPASKSASVIWGVFDGSVPPPVACGLVTDRLEYGLPSIVVIVLEPTLPAEPGATAITLACAVPGPADVIHGTVTLAVVWANSSWLVFI